MKIKRKVILPGGAGLVGQNLVAHLKSKGYSHLVVLDKHRANLGILRQLHPDIVAEYADLSEKSSWKEHFEGADVAVILQAQIGGSDRDQFIRNNIESTQNVLQAIQHFQVPYTVHISSSVVESIANDDYTRTKQTQEKLVLESKVASVILRPTLMFGWFDRKHLGWLSRFMHKVPFFPIPGHGHYLRQPLYAGDFCKVILSCIENQITGKTYNISGLECIPYIEMIRTIKQSTKARCFLLNIPCKLFHILLKTWEMFDNNPPFTATQLKALTAGDRFETIDWPNLFQVEATPFTRAIDETFHDPIYSQVILEF